MKEDLFDDAKYGQFYFYDDDGVRNPGLRYRKPEIIDNTNEFREFMVEVFSVRAGNGLDSVDLIFIAAIFIVLFIAIAI